MFLRAQQRCLIKGRHVTTRLVWAAPNAPFRSVTPPEDRKTNVLAEHSRLVGALHEHVQLNLSLKIFTQVRTAHGMPAAVEADRQQVVKRGEAVSLGWTPQRSHDAGISNVRSASTTRLPVRTCSRLRWGFSREASLAAVRSPVAW